MRVVHLLHRLDDETLGRLREKHLGQTDKSERTITCLDLEGELRSPKHVRDAIYNLQPPAFAIMDALLEASGFSVDLIELRERAVTATRRLSDAVSSGLVAGRSELDLYRRVLAEARRSDLELDGSELALLRVLRQELRIRTVEHFLIEHHSDMQHLLDTGDAYLGALNGIRNGGVAFEVDGRLVLPDDLVPLAKQTLGIEAPTSARQRLFERIAGGVLVNVAQDLGLKSSGSKEDKVRRLLENYVQPTEVLEQVSIGELRDLCRDINVPVGGNKQDLVDRLVNAFATDADIRPPELEPSFPPVESRELGPIPFEALLLSLRRADLSDILVGIGSRRVTGTKEHLAHLLVGCPYSEVTLLRELASTQLDMALDRAALKAGGTKSDRIFRLVRHYAADASGFPRAKTDSS